MHRRLLLKRAGLAGAAAGLGVVALTGCGFELRRTPPMGFSRIALTGFAPRSSMERDLRAALATQVQVVPTSAQAEVVLRALVDERQKVVVASTSASQVREVQLRIRLSFRIDTASGRELAPAAELFLTRDLSYNESLALAKESEELQVLRDMQADIVQQVMRRLAAVKP